jgi:hypothetical protein
MELFQAGHIYDDISLRRVALGVIVFGGANYQIDDIGKAAATATAFCHGMVDLGRDDQLPTVFFKKLDNRVPDLLGGNIIATADEHYDRPGNMTSILFFLQKRIVNVKKKWGSASRLFRIPSRRWSRPDIPICGFFTQRPCPLGCRNAG